MHGWGSVQIIDTGLTHIFFVLGSQAEVPLSRGTSDTKVSTVVKRVGGVHAEYSSFLHRTGPTTIQVHEVLVLL